MARLWDLGCLGVMEQQGEHGPELLAYFAEEIDTGVAGVWLDLPEVDYVAKYQAGLKPVRVGPLVVAPSHAEVTLSDGDAVLWLDPGSAFGTGHHETTYLALEALTGLDLSGLGVLDVGSGSGVLAIAADLLGAERSLGIDVDPATLPVARANAARNRARARFALGGLDMAAGLPLKFDLIVANLYAELHANLFPRYAAHLAPGGRLLLTGILASLRQAVTQAAPETVELAAERSRGDWLLLEYCLRRRG